MSFRLRVAEHDADWLLQRELVINDIQLLRQKSAGQRTKKAVTQLGKHTTPIVLQHIPELTAGQIETARLVLTGANIYNPSIQQDIKDVLDMLGLVPGGSKLATETTILGERRRTYGRCPACKRPSIGLDNDRTLLDHTPRAGVQLSDETRCPGTGQTVPPPQPAPVASLRARRDKKNKTNRQAGAALARLTLPACKAEDPELFFGPDGERQPEREVRERKAKSVCARCRLVEPCLNYALDNDRKHGVWGGTTPEERKPMVRRMRRIALLTERTSA